MTELSKIRNFSIVAHIDHGKSTLADRLLEECNTIDKREMSDQILDSMELERERGITIKARAVKLNYTADDGETYTLNLIDTPGHVDFNYEVSRSLAACEGALLVVDASQGVEAQTLANTYLAMNHDLEILPVINKIDLPAADPERTKAEIEDIIGIPAMEAPEISAKNGINIPAVLEEIVNGVPAPKGDPDAPLKALVFDSQYDSFRGVIVLMRLMDGRVRKDMEIKLMATGAVYKVVEVGHMRPTHLEPCAELSAGDVGYLTASIKNVADTRVGDTVTEAARPAAEPLPGYAPARPMVYCGIYTEDGSKYPDLRDALEKLKLNDASLSFEPESSVALGFGFRCGFLGLLHMEIIQERLRREFNMDIISTYPSVIYEVTKTSGEEMQVDNPSLLPEPQEIQEIREPIVKVFIMLPGEYIGDIMQLVLEKRGSVDNTETIDDTRVMLTCTVPLAEILVDFNDKLKSMTRGYGSMDYEYSGYQAAKLIKMDMLIAGEPVDAFSMIVHQDKAASRGRELAERLKNVIPRQLFTVAIQACIGGKIIARESISPMRKDVTAKCYGGDVTRKRKLLEKQKEGKKRMRQFGTVSVPSEAFLAVLKMDDK